MSPGSGVLLQSLGNGVILNQFGQPQSGHAVYVYVSGTTTQVQVYSNVGLSSTLSQPLTTSATGAIPGYVAGEQAVDFYDSTAGIRMQANPVSAADMATAGITSSGLPGTVVLDSQIGLVLPSGDTTGVTDTANIQAALTAARIAGGGTVRGEPGATYYLTAGSTAITNVPTISSTGANACLVIGSNVILDMTDCFVDLVAGTGAAPIVNYAMVTGTVGTASTTSGSATVTSALPMALGQSLVVYNVSTVFAGGGGISPLCAYLGNAPSGGSAVIQNLDQTNSLTAGGTVTNAPAILYNRDSGGGVRGGYWNFGANTDTANDIYNAKFLFRHVDHWTFQIQGIISTGKGYSLSVADFTDLYADIPNLNTTSLNGDGCHLMGPGYGALINRITGATGDDSFAITASDYPNKNDCSGNVTGVRVNRVDTNSVVRQVNISSGPGNLVDDISVGNVRGWAQNTAGAVLVGDDASQATTTGGTYGTIDLGSIKSKIVSSSAPVVSLVSPAARKIKAFIDYGDELTSPSNHHLPEAVLIDGTSTATIENLELSGQLNCTWTNVSTSFLSHQASSVTVNSATIHDVVMDGNSGNTCYLVSTSTGCVITQLNTPNCQLGSTVTLTNTASGTVTYLNRGKNFEETVGLCYTYPAHEATAAGASTSANRAYYMRVRGSKLGASQITVQVGTASGNISVGVYSNSGAGVNAVPGAAKAITGSVAVVGTAAAQTIPLGSTIDVYEGDWVGIALDNTTATLARANGNPTASSELAGLACMQNTAFPLPTNPSGEFQSTPFFYARVS